MLLAFKDRARTPLERLASIEKLVILALCVAFAVAHIAARWPVSHPPGMVVAEVPEQRPVAATSRLVERGDYQLTPLAEYTIRARVLGTARYRLDAIADLVPLDLALGWGSMSDSRVLDQLHYFQMSRHFYYWASSRVVSPETAKISASNTHVIPADDEVLDELLELKEGDVVRLTGQLVEVTGPNGFLMRSSLRRDDSGDGACELLYVTGVVREAR